MFFKKIHENFKVNFDIIFWIPYGQKSFSN